MIDIAANIQRSWLRLHLFTACAAMLSVLVGGLQATQKLNFGGSQFEIAIDLIFTAVALFGGALAIAVPICTVMSEFEMGTMHMLLAKGVRCREYVAGNLLGHSFALGFVCLLLTLGSLLSGSLWADEQVVSHALGSIAACQSLGLAIVIVWIKLTMLVALALTVASYSRGTVVALIQATSMTCIFHLHDVIEAIQTQTQSNGLAIALRIVRWISPDLAAMNLSDRLAGGQQILASEALRMAVYGLLATTILCLLATSLFERRKSVLG